MGYIKGQVQYRKWEKGKRLTRKEAMLANCYCCNGFTESAIDCGAEKTCTLYPYSPYRSSKKPKTTKTQALGVSKRRSR